METKEEELALLEQLNELKIQGYAVSKVTPTCISMFNKKDNSKAMLFCKKGIIDDIFKKEPPFEKEKIKNFNLFYTVSVPLEHFIEARNKEEAISIFDNEYSRSIDFDKDVLDALKVADINNIGWYITYVEEV